MSSRSANRVRVAVAGGTGVVGRHVVAVLGEHDHEAVVLSRRDGVDVVSGAGLDRALEGADVVVDVSNVASLRRAVAERFFPAVSRRLLDAGRRAGVRHHVALSIVGIDDVDTGYYAGKRAQEQVLLGGGAPASVLRATQFHEFAEQVMHRSGLGPVRPVPRMQVQPVAAREVAEALVELALGDPVGRAPDLGGPQPHDLVDLARRVVAARGERWRVLPLPVPGAPGRAMAGGALLPGPGARLGRTTFEEWLATQ
jgi:uncharacterized protein YbjT (DUF2867 family)